MRILIIDKFFQRRDLAQMDMYSVIAKHHDCIFSENPADIFSTNYDLLYLGIYHQSFTIDWDQALFYSRAPVIIDQADNEEFVERDGILRNSRNAKCVLSRYLPNDSFEDHCHKYGAKYALLPWYVNPDRFYVTPDKRYDVTFIGSLYGKRIDLKNMVGNYGSLTGKSVYSGELWGGEYVDALAQSYMAYMECGRKCVTQKYIEASLCDCVLIGDKPLYPANDFVVYDTIPDNYTNMRGNRDYVLQTFANEERFMEIFNRILE